MATVTTISHARVAQPRTPNLARCVVRRASDDCMDFARQHKPRIGIVNLRGGVNLIKQAVSVAVMVSKLQHCSESSILRLRLSWKACRLSPPNIHMGPSSHLTPITHAVPGRQES